MVNLIVDPKSPIVNWRNCESFGRQKTLVMSTIFLVAHESNQKPTVFTLLCFDQFDLRTSVAMKSGDGRYQLNIYEVTLTDNNNKLVCFFIFLGVHLIGGHSQPELLGITNPMQVQKEGVYILGLAKDPSTWYSLKEGVKIR